MNKLSIILSAIISTMVLLVSAAYAQERPSFEASTSTVVTAEVIAINHESREVTLQGEDGEDFTFVVGKEARNLKQVSVGDIVVAEFIEAVSIEVLEAKNIQAAQAEMLAMARSKEGDMPGAMVIDVQVEVSTVEDIDIKQKMMSIEATMEMHKMTGEM